MQPTALTPDQLPARIASKISTDSETGCWVWTAQIRSDGYGQAHWPGASRLAHRLVYQLLVGDPGPVLDHTCFNKQCVSPMHLRSVTVKQNGEHRSSARVDSATGVRGVAKHANANGYWVRVTHNRKSYYGGSFATLEEAEAAAIALRAKLFSHDDGRIGS